MDEKKLLREIGNIDEKYIEEAKPQNTHKSKAVLKWLSAAAGVCVLITAGALIMNSLNAGHKNADNREEIHTEKGIYVTEIAGEIGENDKNEEGFDYYVYNSKNYNLVREDSEISAGISMEGAVKRFLELNGVEEVSLDKITEDYTEAYDEDYGDMVVHHVETYTYSVFLTGSEMSKEVSIGLINTMMSYSETHSKRGYVKLYLNEEFVKVKDSVSEQGYSDFMEIFVLEEDDYADNWEEMVDIAFTVKDENGNPMKNITYYLEYISGEKGSYQSGFGITDKTGEFTRSAHQNAVYLLHLQKRNAVVYSANNNYDVVVYEEMTVRLEITEACEKEIIWSEEEVEVINDRENPVEIDISEVYDIEAEVFVQLFTETGEQIQLGYADDDGKIVWYNGMDGVYYLTLQRLSSDDVVSYPKHYNVEVKDGKLTIGDEVEEMLLPE